MLQLPVFVMLADQFTACNQAPLASLPLSISPKKRPLRIDLMDASLSKKREREMKKKNGRHAMLLCCAATADLDSF